MGIERRNPELNRSQNQYTWSQHLYASGIAPVMRLAVAEVVSKKASNASVARKCKEAKPARKTSVPLSSNGIPFGRNGNPNALGGLDADPDVTDALFQRYAWQQQEEAKQEQKREEARAGKAARHAANCELAERVKKAVMTSTPEVWSSLTTGFSAEDLKSAANTILQRNVGNNKDAVDALEAWALQQRQESPGDSNPPNGPDSQGQE